MSEGDDDYRYLSAKVFLALRAKSIKRDLSCGVWYLEFPGNVTVAIHDFGKDLSLGRVPQSHVLRVLEVTGLPDEEVFATSEFVSPPPYEPPSPLQLASLYPSMVRTTCVGPEYDLQREK